MLGQHRGRQLHLQATPPSADVDGWMHLCRLIDKGAKALFLPQRTDPAEQITRGALRGSRVSHIRLFHTRGLGQGFQVKAAGYRHYGHQQFAFFCGRKQRLEHARSIQIKLFRRLQTV